MPVLDFGAILRVLVAHDVDFIIIGGVSAALNGAPLNTFDLDVVHSRSPENLQRLLRALQELDAYYRWPPHRKLRPNQSHLETGGHRLLATRFGDLDVLGTVNGLGYDDLRPYAAVMAVTGKVKASVLKLAKLIELKEAAGCDKDKAALPVLRRTLELLRNKGVADC
jgi:hypothetical protein